MGGYSCWCFSLLVLASYGRTTVELADWEMQSSAHLQDPWYKIKVPTTVFAGLVQNGMFNDSLYGLNLKSVDHKQFLVPWHFRTKVEVPDSSVTALLVLKGLNYRASMTVNGHPFGNELIGAFRYFQLDLSGILQQGSNTLELVITPQNNTWRSPYDTVDLGISFIDWAPFPPDNSTGLWREAELVFLEDRVAVDSPLVSCEVQPTAASLTVAAQVSNYAHAASAATVAFTILDPEGKLVASGQSVTPLGPGQATLVTFSPASFPQLKLSNPRLWWPWQLGEAWLYRLVLNVTVAGKPSDSLSAQFGVRQITDEIDSQGFRFYKVNGKPLLIRGGGYAPSLFLESETDAVWQGRLLNLTRAANLNAIRFEGKFPNGRMFELADQMGMLMIAGFACCDAWQHWKYWGKEQMEVARESLRSQVRRLRIHPSVLSFWYSSDDLPPAAVEQMYLDVFKEEAWPNPTLASASKLVSNITGPTGVKMSGPYSWVPPNYWLNDSKAAADYGGAFGFLTEGGPGESPLTLEALSASIEPGDLWPIGKAWDFHCGNEYGVFHDLRFFTPPLLARYGNATSATDYLKKAQAATYESHRAMFEAYGRNKYAKSTGVIQWMLNSAWPSNIWNLIEPFWTTGGAFFGTKKACEDLHPQFSINDRSVWVVNSRNQAASLKVQLEIYSPSASLLYSQAFTVASPADSSLKIGTVPSAIPGLTRTYFLRLSALLQNGETTWNDYWLSTAEDVLDFPASNFYRTPCTAYADLTALQHLPVADVSSSVVFAVEGSSLVANVSLVNQGAAIAFMVHVRLLRSGAVSAPLSPPDVAPVFWSDNFVTLLPGERRTLQASMARADAGAALPTLQVEPFNAERYE